MFYSFLRMMIIIILLEINILLLFLDQKIELSNLIAIDHQLSSIDFQKHIILISFFFHHLLTL